MTGSHPLIVYSHSHSGNKAEGVNLFEALIARYSFVIFDYTGYGYSDSDHCTLGLKEKDDLEAVINYSKTVYGFQRVYVWGRSMGAVTALLLTEASRNSCCQGMIIDSPFSSTKEMVNLPT